MALNFGNPERAFQVNKGFRKLNRNIPQVTQKIVILGSLDTKNFDSGSSDCIYFYYSTV